MWKKNEKESEVKKIHRTLFIAAILQLMANVKKPETDFFFRKFPMKYGMVVLTLLSAYFVLFWSHKGNTNHLRNFWYLPAAIFVVKI